jgi:3-oxoadipate enol-lactonase
MPYVSTEWGNVYYEVHGEGPALMFVHGSGGNHSSWWQQVPHFRDRYQVVTVDLPGFGLSVRNDREPEDAAYPAAMLAVLDDAKIDRAVVVAGQGASPVLTLAINNPDRVAAAVTSHSLRGLDDEKLQAMAGADRAEADKLSTGDRLMSKEFQQEHPERVFLFWQLGTFNVTPSGAAGRVRSTLSVTPDQVNDVIARGVDVCFLRSTEETVVGPATYEYLQELLPGCHIETMEGAHSVYWENPDRFNATLDRILERAYRPAAA